MKIEEIITNELPKLQGWCSVEKGLRMAELCRGTELCVELGVFGGRGLVAMALPLAEQNSGQAHGIDPFTTSAAVDGTNDQANSEWWRGIDFEEIARGAQEALDRLGLANHARLIRMNSSEVAACYEDGSIDVLHQDSNHSEEVSCQEVALWHSKISPGGYWIADDTNWASTQKAQRELVALGFVELEDHETWKVYRRP